MLSLITGASSGIGKAFAYELASRGSHLILASRNLQELDRIATDLTQRYKITVQTISVDLSKQKDCKRLYDTVYRKDIDLLINNAGIGVHGTFATTSLQQELQMLDLNVRAVHVLTKLFLRDFLSRNHGTIVNVCSSAGFLSGPLMSSYYAGKNYVVRLTEGIAEELSHTKYKDTVHVCAICPGPVNTPFHVHTHIKTATAGISPEQVAKVGIDCALSGKTLIFPDFQTKLLYIIQKALPSRLVRRVVYQIQKRKYIQKGV